MIRVKTWICRFLTVMLAGSTAIPLVGQTPGPIEANFSINRAYYQWYCSDCESIGEFTSAASVSIGFRVTPVATVGISTSYWRITGDPYHTVGPYIELTPTPRLFLEGSLNIISFRLQGFAFVGDDIGFGFVEPRLTRFGTSWSVGVAYDFFQLGGLVWGPTVGYESSLGALQSPYGFRMLRAGLRLGLL